jgi:hypothetical protein
MVDSPTSGNQLTERDWQLEVSIRLDPNGPEVLRETVANADLADSQAEVWFEGCLRRGYTSVSIDDLSFRTVPIVKKEGSGCVGFLLESTNPGGERIGLDFSIHSLEHVAGRASERLMAAGVLKTGQHYYYRIVPCPRDAASSAGTAGPGEAVRRLTLKEKTPLVNFLTVPIRPLLERSKAVNTAEHRYPYPVFYTQEAHAKAEKISRKGAEFSPAVETGGLLLGPLCTCPESRQLFAVIMDILELLDAAQAPYSLTPSGRTWQRIQAVVRAMQKQPATESYRLIGNCHGHNFLPPAAATGTTAACRKLTSVFVSIEDGRWSQAVFHRQPYQLCHIFGLDSAGDKVEGLFGLEDGRLLERGYYVIPDFDPALNDQKPNVMAVQEHTTRKQEK